MKNKFASTVCSVVPDEIKSKGGAPGAPLGFTSVKVLTPAAVAKANEILNRPTSLASMYGYTELFKDNSTGKEIIYILKVEGHCDNHPALPAYKKELEAWNANMESWKITSLGEEPSKPMEPAPYWHPGVTVYQIDESSEAGASIAAAIRGRVEPVASNTSSVDLIPSPVKTSSKISKLSILKRAIKLSTITNKQR